MVRVAERRRSPLLTGPSVRGIKRQAPTGSLISLLLTGLSPYRRGLAALTALQLAQTAALLYLPKLSADIIDDGVLAADPGFVLRRGAQMLLVSLLQVGFAVGTVVVGTRIAMAIGHDLRRAVFTRVLSFSSHEMSRFGTASLITRTTNDVQQLQTLVSAALTGLVAAPITAVGGAVLALGQDVPMAAALLAVVPLLGLPLGILVRRLRPHAADLQKGVDVVNRVLHEQVSGVRVIRAFSRDDYEQRRFTRANEHLTNSSLRAGLLTSSIFPLTATLVNLFGVVMLWLGAYRIRAGGLQVGALTAFLGYLALILVAVVTAAFTLMAVPRAEVCARRIAEVLATETSIPLAERPIHSLPPPGHLELRDVSFRFPGAQEPVLRNVDLVAPQGETTALVGSTGSGKSTLLGLILRLADPTTGHVLVGGEDVRSLDRSVLCRSVGLVPQNAPLLSGTVASNLRLGRPDASDEELWHALTVAQAKDFVEALDKGLDTPVAQGGNNFSGGQRQRLVIARTLVHHPQVYLFDDAFSALDPATEVRLRTALAAQVADATVVLVAQRVATLRHADRIVVLDAGVVVGTGTHDELLASSPVYREIVLSQSDEEGAQ
ncbi:ABC transporter ATP-binding protein/permease [Kitasatospora purpeofusca]|uniref:ABC transporter ATP-binding protein n=1 Tax=Kitasatospora purpeofusca TaxID=67352 RepID=UPI00324E6BC5